MEEEPYKLGETGKPLHRVDCVCFFFLFLLMALFCSGGNAAVAGLFQILLYFDARDGYQVYDNTRN